MILTILGGVASVKGSLSEMITPPSLIHTLQDCGVDMLTLANDHALDGGADELKATLQNLKDAGMDELVGQENICSHISIALERAAQIVASEPAPAPRHRSA